MSLRSDFFYKTLAPLYNQFVTSPSYREAIARFFGNLEFNLENKNILDAGCGTGVVALVLARQHKEANIIGFDKSCDMVYQAEKARIEKRYNNLEFCFGDITKVNPLKTLDGRIKTIERESFGNIIVSGALEHVNLNNGIKELVKYLVRGGTFYSSSVRNNKAGRRLGKVMDFKPYSTLKVMEALADAGLKDISEISIYDRKLSKFRIAIKGTKS